MYLSSPIVSPACSSYSSYSMASITSSASCDSRPQGPNCAFPSWPRRSSLDGGVSAEPTSFISDEDLYPDVFDENESDCTPIASPSRSPPQQEVEVVDFTSIREMIAMHKQQEQEKRRRRKRRSSSSSSRRSKTGLAKNLSTIQEVRE
jgi:hypothetical protein